jgi:hypothetical protein
MLAYKKKGILSVVILVALIANYLNVLHKIPDLQHRTTVPSSVRWQIMRVALRSTMGPMWVVTGMALLWSMVVGFGNGVPRTPQATTRATETRDFQANEGGGEIRRE